jgi:hypothetical protein
MRRHYLKNKAEAEENPAAPPANRGEKVTGLPDSDESILRRACPAEARGKSGSLSALQENRENDDDAVDDQQRHEKRVKH